MNKFGRLIVAVGVLCAFFPVWAAGQPPIKIVEVIELSGGGATPGTNFKKGADLAIKEINAAGGILGRQIETTTLDTQSNPATAKAMTQKAIDMGAYVVMGPVFSGSVIVSMEESRRAEIPNFVGGEAANITKQGNPYVFRTSFTQETSMPKLARYFKDRLKAQSVAIMWINNDFGKGGRDEMLKALQAQGIKVVADVSTDPQQVDFTSAVLKVKEANADALFVYLNEEESARALNALRRRGFEKPIVGETTLTGQKVIDLAGKSANGVVGHVGLTADAPLPALRAFGGKFSSIYYFKPDHNALKGYIGIYVVKAVTEKIGKFDSKAFAAAMKNLCLSAKDHPGILMDVCYDSKGDIDRESFLVEVRKEAQEVVEVLPPLNVKTVQSK